MTEEKQKYKQRSFNAGANRGLVMGGFAGGIIGLMAGYFIPSHDVETPRVMDVNKDGRPDVVLYHTDSTFSPDIFLQQEDGTYRKVQDVNSNRLKELHTEVERVKKLQNQELRDWYMRINQDQPNQGGKSK